MPPKFTHMQRSNFNLAPSAPLEKSTNQLEFRVITEDARPQMNESTRANLRASHFSLARAVNPETGSTETRDQFRVRVPDPVKPVEDLHLKPGNIQLGEHKSSKSDFMSTNQLNFVRIDANFEKTKPTELQKSSIKIGSGQSEYQTAKDDFKPFDQNAFPQIYTQNFQKSSVQVSDGLKNEYTTEAMRFKPVESTVDHVRDKRKFQNSSLKLFDDFAPFPKSQTQEDMARALNTEHCRPEKMQDLHLLGSNINLGDKNTAFNYTSETKASFKANEGKPAEMIKPAQPNTKLNVFTPETNEIPVSEFKKEFKAWDGDINTDDAQKIKKFMSRPTDPNCQKSYVQKTDYRSAQMVDYQRIDQNGKEEKIDKMRHLQNNIKMTYDPQTNIYVSRTNEMLQQSAAVENIAQVNQIDLKLRQSNIKLAGNNNGNYETTYRQQFVQREACKSELNQAKLNDLRRTHYKLGTGQTEYQTEFRSSIKAYDDYVEDGKYIGANTRK
ncbi:Conserved_hypothetical protein [Hexamita inflata]|uniref:Uncharacterized protein n=1 Tax=Hexamita inflata TaxID=28002 RepID=A0AA86NCD6_9EUKA|nr:Conserved hypothetical protein [Hexamita inflata]